MNEGRISSSVKLFGHERGIQGPLQQDA